MKTAIALIGKADTGKTKTIKQVFHLLLQRHTTAKVEPVGRRLPVEVYVILTIGDVKIGITSKGDPRTDLLKRLLLLSSRNCEIIVCTARVTKDNKLLEDVEKLKPEYHIVWKKKIGVARALQDSNNEKMAMEIVQEIETLLH